MATRARRRRGAAGFTLLEMLVVLVIISGLLAIAVPGFERLYAKLRLAFDRDDIERQLLALPQQVRLTGRGGLLMDAAGLDPTQGGTPFASEGRSEAFDGFEHGQLLRLDLPSGWSYEVSQPILYHFNGACDGGEVTVSLAPYSLRYLLTAPLCRPRLADATAP